MLWEVDIYPAEGQVDLMAREVATQAADLGLARDLRIRSARGYLIQGVLNHGQVARIAHQLLADRVVERTVVAPVGDEALGEEPGARGEGRGARDEGADSVFSIQHSAFSIQHYAASFFISTVLNRQKCSNSLVMSP